jgi:hypothetical protein
VEQLQHVVVGDENPIHGATANLLEPVEVTLAVTVLCWQPLPIEALP